MNRFTWKTEWFALSAILIGLLATWKWFPLLPTQVPSHWNLAGKIDGWISPIGHVAMFMGLMIFIYLLFTAIPYLEPRKANMENSLGFLQIMKNSMMGFFLLLYLAISYAAIYNSSLPMDKLIGIGVGVLFIIIGLSMAGIKSNYFMGIRTPWTLSSDEIWNKTHRVGSVLFTIAGGLFVVFALLPSPWNFIIPLIGMLIAVIVPIVYSYHLFQEEHK